VFLAVDATVISQLLSLLLSREATNNTQLNI